MNAIESVSGVVRAILELDGTQPLRDSLLLRDDLGMSSLQLVMIVTELCSEHGISLDDLTIDDVNTLKTVGNLAQLLEEKAHGQ